LDNASLSSSSSAKATSRAATPASAVLTWLEVSNRGDDCQLHWLTGGFTPLSVRELASSLNH